MLVISTSSGCTRTDSYEKKDVRAHGCLRYSRGMGVGAGGGGGLMVVFAVQDAVVVVAVACARA